MEKKIKVGNKELKLKTSAALPRLYRLKFNRDIFVDFETLAKSMTVDASGMSSIPIECLSIFEEIAFTMAKYADPDNVPDSIDDWLDQYETFDIYTIIPHIIDMWNIENITTSTAKKKKGQPQGK